MNFTSIMSLLGIVLLCGCSITGQNRPAPLQTVPHVDLDRFMGDWYVIAIIPWFFERNNVGTMDIYEARPDGKIDIRYVFHKKSLEAPRKEMKAVARVLNRETNAEWRVQFLWPFEAPFLIIDLSDDYGYTVIGHPSRDLLWIMARKPVMAEGDYENVLRRLTGQGYDTSRIVKVPQHPIASK